MFVLTLGKNGLRKLGALAVAGVALAGVVFAAGSFFRQDDAAAAAAKADETTQVMDPTKLKIAGAENIAEFFKAYGLEVDLSTATVDKVKVPKKWDESFSAFNTVVKESGLSLEKFKGKTMEKWVVLCPGRSTGDQKVSCVLLVYKEKPTGAYLLAQPSGEVTGLVATQQTAAPLTEEELAAANAQFGEEAQDVAAPPQEPAAEAGAPVDEAAEAGAPVDEAAEAGAPVDEAAEANAPVDEAAEAGADLDLTNLGEMPIE